MAINDQPLIITCAVVGAELKRDVFPFLPLTPEEIAQSSIEAVQAGASIIHLHVRDENGLPSQRVDLFEKTSKLIKKEVDCILQFSTGGAVGTSVDSRCQPLQLKPEMATLSMGTMNFGEEIYENTPSIIRQIASEMKKNNIHAELEIFDLSMLEGIEFYKKKGWIPQKHHIDFVLGVPGGLSGDVKNLVELVRRLPVDQKWSVAGIGRFQLPLTYHALALGGHIRVGLEDNINFHKGELAQSNAQFVQRVVRLANELNRPIANASMARSLLF